MTFSTKTAGTLSAEEQCFSTKDREKDTVFLQNRNNDLAYPFRPEQTPGKLSAVFTKKATYFVHILAAKIPVAPCVSDKNKVYCHRNNVKEGGCLCNYAGLLLFLR